MQPLEVKNRKLELHGVVSKERLEYAVQMLRDQECDTVVINNCNFSDKEMFSILNETHSLSSLVISNNEIGTLTLNRVELLLQKVTCFVEL